MQNTYEMEASPQYLKNEFWQGIENIARVFHRVKQSNKQSLTL